MWIQNTSGGPYNYVKSENLLDRIHIGAVGASRILTQLFVFEEGSCVPLSPSIFLFLCMVYENKFILYIV